MVIKHNLNAMNAHRNMGEVTNKQGKAMEKLSSGLRINRAGDDAAGLAISEKMRSQIRGLDQASRNAQDGISMIQTAEGALSETQAITQRMRELAVQSANGTYTNDDRKLINQEFVQLKKEIDRIGYDTEFNGIPLLDGNISDKLVKTEIKDSNIGNNKHVDISAHIKISKEDSVKLWEGKFTFEVIQSQDKVAIKLSEKDKDGIRTHLVDEVRLENRNPGSAIKEEIVLDGVKFNVDIPANKLAQGQHGEVAINNTLEPRGDGVKVQVGANQDQTIGFSVDNMRSKSLDLKYIDLLTPENSQNAISTIDKAISKISSERSKIGAAQNRLEHTISSVNNTSENLQSSESRIRDVDMAKEMMNLTKLNVLQQASQAMLAQANQAPQQVMSILK